MANNNIKALKEISKIDSAIAGGKGASLGELLKIGILVPDGFIILSNVFDNFLKKTELYSTINKTLKELDFKKSSTIKTASNKIKKLILSKEIPNEIKNEILVNFKNLRSDFVAIRSSATTEDSISAAWAGQLNSYLNTTEETILENIKECWASLFNERAIHYRFENKLINKKISVAVVVQKMIQAEKSGVAFSVHPVTQNNNQIIIEAGFGLGEAIVSGEITPDSYIIDKTSYKITDIKANKKVKALYKKSKGGDIWKKLKEKSNQQVLTKNEITKLSKIVVQIEKHYGFPCDIEWAKEKNNFYITQSRPITTLSNTKDVQEYYKIMTRPLSLVDCECWDIGERIKLPQKFHNLLFFDPLFICTPKKAVAVYYNFTDPKQNPQPLIDYLEKNLDWFKNEKTSFDKNCNEIRALIINKSRDLKKLLLLNHEIWPMIAIANVLGSTELLKISKKLRGICIKIRKESDDVLHPSLTYINKLISKNYQIKDFQHIGLSEYLENNISNKKIIKRRKGWLYHKHEIIYDYQKYFDDKKIKIINPSKKTTDVISGNIGCKGNAKGKARLIFELSELSKIKKGDILVTPMTTPEMIPVLNKISAIITDEGGITCHAAIVSRELKIPCIIGAINATDMIRDNDLLEVDATNGIVRKIK